MGETTISWSTHYPAAVAERLGGGAVPLTRLWEQVYRAIGGDVKPFPQKQFSTVTYCAAARPSPARDKQPTTGEWRFARLLTPVFPLAHVRSYDAFFVPLRARREHGSADFRTQHRPGRKDFAEFAAG